MSRNDSRVGPDWPLIDRYLAGDCTLPERAAVDAWLAENPVARLPWLEAVRQMRNASAVLPESVDVERMSRTAASRTNRSVSRLSGRSWKADVRSSRWRYGSWAVFAGGVATALTLGIWVMTPAKRALRAQPFRQVVTASGAREPLTLPDGTRLTLGPTTRLRIPADFGVGSRTVEISGEALFVVVHDARHPFVVRTSRAVVQDVGTTFVVRDYPGDNAARVAVQDGEVSLRGCERAESRAGAGERPSGCALSSLATPLRAGDLATVSDTIFAVRHEANLAPLIAWLQGGLAFDDTPVRDAVDDISRVFGVTIAVGDSALLRRHITGNFAGQTLDVVLDFVTRAIGAKYERRDSHVVIRSVIAASRDDGDRGRQPMITARARDAR